MLPRIPGAEKPVSLEQWNRFTGHFARARLIDTAGLVFRSDVDQILFPTHEQEGVAEALGLVDNFLSSAGYLIATECDDHQCEHMFGDVLKALMTPDVQQFYKHELLPKYLYMARLAQSGVANSDFYREEVGLSFVHVVLRNMASYALWRSVEMAGNISHPDCEKQMRHVAAVALNAGGYELDRAYRGEGFNGNHRSVHAEHTLLMKLEEGDLLNSVFLVGVNLTPCKERSQKHAEALGGDCRGCAQRLVDAGVPVVASCNPDEGASGRGRGREILIKNKVVMFEAEHPLAVLSGALANRHFDDMRQQLERIDKKEADAW